MRNASANVGTLTTMNDVNVNVGDVAYEIGNPTKFVVNDFAFGFDALLLGVVSDGIRANTGAWIDLNDFLRRFVVCGRWDFELEMEVEDE